MRGSDDWRATLCVIEAPRKRRAAGGFQSQRTGRRKLSPNSSGEVNAFRPL
jgi:hypothetical protein